MSWKIQSILAMLLLSVMVVLITEQTKKGLSVPFIMFAIAIVWLISFGGVLAKEGINFTVSHKTIAVLVLIGLLSFLANWLLFLATSQNNSPGPAMAIFNSSAVVITFIYYLLIGTPISFVKIIGIVMCTVGVIIISLSK